MDSNKDSNLFSYTFLSLSGLPQLVPQMATSGGLLMPASAAVMCNTFMPTAHLQHLFGQIYPAPMTPDSSPSAPSVSSSNPTPPRNVTPITEPSGSMPTTAEENRSPTGVLNAESSILCPSLKNLQNSQNEHNILSRETQSTPDVVGLGTSSSNTNSSPVLQNEYHGRYIKSKEI